MFKKDLTTGKVSIADPIYRADYIKEETKNLQKSVELEEKHRRQELLHEDVTITSGEYAFLTGIITRSEIRRSVLLQMDEEHREFIDTSFVVRIDSFSNPIWVSLQEDEFEII